MLIQLHFLIIGLDRFSSVLFSWFLTLYLLFPFFYFSWALNTYLYSSLLILKLKTFFLAFFFAHKCIWGHSFRGKALAASCESWYITYSFNLYMFKPICWVLNFSFCLFLYFSLFFSSFISLNMLIIVILKLCLLSLATKSLRSLLYLLSLGCMIFFLAC